MDLGKTVGIACVFNSQDGDPKTSVQQLFSFSSSTILGQCWPTLQDYLLSF